MSTKKGERNCNNKTFYEKKRKGICCDNEIHLEYRLLNVIIQFYFRNYEKKKANLTLALAKQ